MRLERVRWRGWAERSQVERVDLYTRQSLYALLWLMPLTVLLQLAANVGEEATAVGLAAALLAYLVLGVAATRCLRAACALYPAHRPLPWRLVADLVVPALLVVVLALALAGESVRAVVAMTVWVLLAMGLGGFRDRWLTLAVLVAAAALPLAAGAHAGLALFAVGGTLFLMFTIRASLWLYDVVAQLDDARAAQAALAVAEERLRFSRDLHDVMGRRLSTIAVQAELAATLARRGDEAAPDRMLDVRSVAHEALRETRELARGYRATDLDQELSGARSLLRSAGIETRVRIDALPPAWHEPAGWVVREAVTNVLRHSAATIVDVGYDGSALTVENDGVADGPAPTATVTETPSTPGTGLTGLRERLAPLGAILTTEAEPGHFRLRVTLPPTPTEGTA